MGLTAVASTVDLHGGAIELQSELGQGSTFTLHLPLTEHPAEAPPRIPGEQRVEQEGEVLVIDEEPMAGLFLAEVLRAEGYRVHQFTDARQAITHHQQRHQMIGVIILDRHNPHLSPVAPHCIRGSGRDRLTTPACR